MSKKYGLKQADIMVSLKRCFLKKMFSMTVLFVFFSSVVENQAIAQNTYTLGDGTLTNSTLGVSPFATINRNSKSQYLFLAHELLMQDAIHGNIVSFALNIKTLALPTSIKPENIKIKLGLTDDVVLGTELVEGLTEHYSSSVENITEVGWHTFTFHTPFEWDGYSNIIVEICRSNVNFGTSFAVESKLNNALDYRSIGLYTNSETANGCTMSGVSPMINTYRRTRPNAQFTMTNPCDGVPMAGVTVVTGGLYCSGSPFTLSIENGSIESGLYYQWQSSPNENGPWTNIEGANNGTYTTSQAISTYYRRTTTCIESQQTIDALAILVGGEGCYCTALVINENNIGIKNVSLNTLNNTSTAIPAYTNYTNIQTTVNRNSSYDITVSVSTAGGNNYTKVWFDWDASGSFEVSEGYELDFNSNTFNVLIPTTAVLGTIKMRVRTKQSATNDYPLACGAIENGETEDYSVVIDEELSISNPSKALVNVVVYQNNDAVIVKTDDGNLVGSIRVFDLSGRLLLQKSNLHETEIVLDLFDVKNQVLFFQIETIEGIVQTKKVILK